MISNPRHGSPPRLMAHQPTRCSTTQESSIRVHRPEPVSGATVEIWQCDAHGRYLHPADTGKRPRDSAFQGYGRITSGADGAYRFRTIRPVAYPGRTPHIHFAVRPPDDSERSRPLIERTRCAGGASRVLS